MLVRKSNDIATSIREEAGRLPSNIYCVFAIYFSDHPQFIIQLEEFPSAPSAFDARIFDIVDARISRYWRYSPAICGVGNPRPPILAFEEWATDPTFYEDVIEGRGEAGRIWRKYRSQMELEFSPPEIITHATRLIDNWVQCFQCLDSWEDAGTSELLVCPYCKGIQRRPTEELRAE